MTKTSKIPASDDAWDSGMLGEDSEHASVSQRTDGKELDDALELQLISIRLPKAMIEDLKFIADKEGMKYQPLIRRVLMRFADCEMKKIARALSAEAKARKDDEPNTPQQRFG